VDDTDAGVRLDFHERGFGPFTARLGAAATPLSNAVAATALSPVAASSKTVTAVPATAGAGSGGEGDDEDDKKHGKSASGDDSDDENDD
jgi:hypothetical protein